MIDILHRYTKAVLYHSETAQTIAEAVQEAQEAHATLAHATLVGANLAHANLAHATLAHANLAHATLAHANLAHATLAHATLAHATLAGANLVGANLRGANLRDANLAGATLVGATLAGANLVGATLAGANLVGATLAGANLVGATLAGAKGVDKYRCTPLLMLLDQPGLIRAYKLVTADGVGPFNGGITYRVGEQYEVSNANTDADERCGAGINVATLDWCIREWRPGYQILTMDFLAADIAAIPTATDGKFRVHRCTISGVVDLVKIGLMEETPDAS